MRIENTLLTGIDKYNNSLKAEERKDKEVFTPNGQAFEDIYKASMNMVEETSNYQKNATQLQMDFVSGKTDDILAVTMAQEKALTSLNFTVQITNKLVDAYKQIMQLQV